MQKAFSFFSGYKTYLVGVAGVLYALGIGQNWWPHSATADIVLGSTGVMTLRAAIAKLCVIASQALNYTPPAAKALVVCALLPAILCLSSCSYLTPAQQATSAQLAAQAVTIGANALNAAVDVGLATASSKISSSNPYLSAVAQGLRTLENTKVVSQEQIQSITTQFGDPSNPGTWSALGKSLADAITNYGKTAATDAALEAAAMGLNQLNLDAAKISAS